MWINRPDNQQGGSSQFPLEFTPPAAYQENFKELRLSLFSALSSEDNPDDPMKQLLSNGGDNHNPNLICPPPPSFRRPPALSSTINNRAWNFPVLDVSPSESRDLTPPLSTSPVPPSQKFSNLSVSTCSARGRGPSSHSLSPRPYQGGTLSPLAQGASRAFHLKPQKSFSDDEIASCHSPHAQMYDQLSPRSPRSPGDYYSSHANQAARDQVRYRHHLHQQQLNYNNGNDDMANFGQHQQRYHAANGGQGSAHGPENGWNGHQHPDDGRHHLSVNHNHHHHHQPPSNNIGGIEKSERKERYRQSRQQSSCGSTSDYFGSLNDIFFTELDNLGSSHHPMTSARMGPPSAGDAASGSGQIGENRMAGLFRASDGRIYRSASRYTHNGGARRRRIRPLRCPVFEDFAQSTEKPPPDCDPCRD